MLTWSADEIARLRDRVELYKVGCRPGPCPCCDGGPIVVVDARRLWSCPDCGAGGDAFAWVQKAHDVDFKTAVRVVERIVEAA